MKEKKKFFVITSLAVVLCIFHAEFVFAQSLQDKLGRAGLNTITTAVPFLTISPDSRAGGMGDVGVATAPDVNSLHWNPSKLAFIEKQSGFSLSYTPWLRNLVPDINLSYLSAYSRIDNYQVIAGSLRYFSLGSIQFTDEYGNNTMQFTPKEFALDLGYARKLSKYFSGGIAIRYINSNLTGRQFVQGAESKPGRAVATDVSVYFENKEIKLGDKNTELAAGLNISNVGNKMSYTNTSRTDFIPINLKLGPRYTIHADQYNKISFTAEINRLMVPTPPIRETTDPSSRIIAGKDPDRAVANGMFGSFNDAPGIIETDANGNRLMNNDGTAQIVPGSVFREEMREFMWAAGAEYWYDNQFALRTGYFWEHALKGNRKYATVGAGLRYNVFSLDFSYLIPVYLGTQNQTLAAASPLQNTLRFTLLFDFAALGSGDKLEPK